MTAETKRELPGRTSGYFVSAQEYAELQRLRALERRAYRLSEQGNQQTP
jgi:hypothetical protein